MGADNYLPTVELTGGTVGFIGMARGVDEMGHEVFQIQLRNDSVLYGEYKKRFLENGNDFNIEIISFGLIDRKNFGNNNLDSFRKFREDQVDLIRSLIIQLFTSDDAVEARKPIDDFWYETARFLGEVYFLPGWIRVSR